MPNDISVTNKELDQEEKELYECLQSFCIINIKIERNINRLISSVCLTKLVENCPYVLKNNYMKYILDNILDNISKNNFNVKNELLNWLISLILGAESLMKVLREVVYINDRKNSFSIKILIQKKLWIVKLLLNYLKIKVS